MMKNYFLKSIRLFIGMLFMASALQAQIYVNSTAGGANDGTSWANAYTDLQSALAAAVSPNEIWVAAGTYYPTQVTTDRNATFQLKNGVAVYGGFDGTETMLSERDWVAIVTILSGDINQSTTLTDNSYSVVTGSGTNATAVIDGFNITMGNANVTTGSLFDPPRFGGGMYNNNGSPTVTNCTFSGNTAFKGGGMGNWASSPTVTNCTFSGNTASSSGGGMYNIGSSPTVTNCTFSGNTADHGGGMYNSNGSPEITNSTFSGNSANRGGGMHNAVSSPTVTNCTFSGNTVSFDGGGMYNDISSPTVTNSSFLGNTAGSWGGGMYNDEYSPTVTNCTFSGNSANRGGGMLNLMSSTTVTNCTFTGNSANQNGGGMWVYYNSSPTITNSSFSGNSAPTGGGMHIEFNSSPTVTNSIIWGNSSGIVEDMSTPTVNYSIVQGGHAGTANLDEDPLFVDQPPVGLGTAGDLRLTPCSPAINAGSNAAVPGGITTDLDGNPRIFGGTVDMGAYEFQGEKHVNPTNGGEIAASQLLCSGELPDPFTSNSPASGFVGDLEYQWQISTASPTFVDITGAVSETYTHTGSVTQTTWFRRLAKVTCETTWVESNAIQVDVNPLTIAGTATNTQTICNGDTPVDLELTGHFGNVLRWQRSADEAFTSPTDIAETSATLAGTTIGALTQTTWFRAEVQSGVCDPEFSDPVVVHVDVTPPSIVCAADSTVGLDDEFTCGHTVEGIGFDPVSFDDNCVVASVVNDYTGANTLDGAFFPLLNQSGSTSYDVVWTVTDNAGLSTSCTVVITVSDDQYPVWTGYDPQDVTLFTNQTDCEALHVWNRPTVSDVFECSDFSIAEDINNANVFNNVNNTFGIYNDKLGGQVSAIFPVGQTVVSYTATDVNDNKTTVSFTVTVIDNILPTVITQNITVSLDANGTVTVDPSQIDNGTTDNCGIATMTLSRYNFGCSDMGNAIPVTLSVTDVNGNTASCTATVTVNELSVPLVRVNIRATSAPNGQVKFTAYPVNGGDNPTYKWFKEDSNGVVHKLKDGTENFLITTCKSGDVHWVELTSSIPCTVPDRASNAMCTY